MLLGLKKNKKEKNLTWGGKNTIQYTDDVLQNYTPETYIILLTSVTPINSIKKIHVQNQESFFPHLKLPHLNSMAE